MTEREKSDKSYQQEAEAHGQDEMLRAIGTKADYYRDVFLKGEATNFSRWMATPEPDWQRDC